VIAATAGEPTGAPPTNSEADEIAPVVVMLPVAPLIVVPPMVMLPVVPLITVLPTVMSPVVVMLPVAAVMMVEPTSNPVFTTKFLSVPAILGILKI